jgi:hypothetical protein
MRTTWRQVRSAVGGCAGGHCGGIQQSGGCDNSGDDHNGWIVDR